MAPASMPPTTEAREVFRSLGYTISDGGTTFVAERKWRRVHVVPLGAEDAREPERVLTDGGEDGARLRCYVTWKRAAPDLREFLLGLKPPYDWAVIGVDREGDFEVMQGAPNTP